MKTTVESGSASNYIIRVVVARDAAMPMAPKHEDSGRIGTACQFRLTFLDSGELYLHFYDRYWKPLGKKEDLPGLGEYTYVLVGTAMLSFVQFECPRFAASIGKRPHRMR